jgi:hypothetical protein
LPCHMGTRNIFPRSVRRSEHEVDRSVPMSRMYGALCVPCVS